MYIKTLIPNFLFQAATVQYKWGHTLYILFRYLYMLLYNGQVLNIPVIISVSPAFEMIGLFSVHLL